VRFSEDPAPARLEAVRRRLGVCRRAGPAGGPASLRGSLRVLLPCPWLPLPQPLRRLPHLAAECLGETRCRPNPP
jgi:hypothetical protein